MLNSPLRLQLTKLAWIVMAMGLISPSGPLRAPTVHAAPTTVRYRVNAAHSHFLAHVLRAGLFKAFGHDHIIAINDIAGEVRTATPTLLPAMLHLTIKADSLTVADAGHASDRPKIERTMKEQVLETARYPTINYTSSSVTSTRAGDGSYRVQITGDLTLHGVTRSQPVTAQVTVRGHSLQALGEFSIRQTDYKMKPVSAVGGTVKVKDEVKFTFSIVAEEVAD